MLRLLQDDGTCQNTDSTSEEAKKTTQAMTEVPEASKFSTLEKCPLDRWTMKIYINICFVNMLLDAKIVV